MELATFLQHLTPVLSVLLATLALDIVLRLFGAARDQADPLLGLPSVLTGLLQNKLNRAGRTQSVRRQRGLITFAFIFCIGLVLGFVIQYLASDLPLIAPLLWFLCLRATVPWTAGMELRQAANVAEAMAVFKRRRMFVTVSVTDMHGAVRHFLVETALIWARGTISPVFWGLMVAMLHGPALLGAVMATTLTEAERMLRLQGAKSSGFIVPFARAEAVLNFVPARIAALLLALAAIFTPGAKPATALRAMFSHAENFAHANDGWPVAAMSGALQVALRGDGKEWVGTKDATARADLGHVLRGVWLHAVATGLLMLILSAMLLLSLAV